MRMPSVPERIHHRESWLDSSDGIRLFDQSWFPDEPKALVLIVHGFAEHSARHAPVALHLARAGFAAHAFDLRGHGRSQGRRCFVSAFDEYLDDTQAAFLSAAHRYPGKPVYFLGHSLGGLIGVLFAIEGRAELSGLVLSAPLLKLGRDYSEFKIKTTLVLGRLFPRFPVTKIRSSSISRDPVVVRAYREDALVYHGRTRARTASEIVRAIRRAQAGAIGVDAPLLILYGSQDQIVEPGGSKEFYAHAHSPDKSMRMFEGLYHEIMHEPEQTVVLDEITQWLDTRAARAE
jgi:acylglycerol lipase